MELLPITLSSLMQAIKPPTHLLLRSFPLLLFRRHLVLSHDVAYLTRLHHGKWCAYGHVEKVGAVELHGAAYTSLIGFASSF